MPMLYERYGQQVVNAVCPIPMGRARYCLGCELVYDQQFGSCPKCGSRIHCTLADWIGHITR